MSGDILIKVEGVSKKFCHNLKKSLWHGLQDIASEVVGRKIVHNQLRPEEFWAVNDVSFELKRGECLGLIGRNGAGKTTLLKMLNGLIKPSKGRIEMRGQVGALIALGAGFNPILTGRENIYVNGSLLGLSKKETDAKFDEIVDFAELGEFINTPVQSYSSGMSVRLGFAVAAMLNPDILLLDEVLAVGDAAFRNKCYRRISEIKKNAAIIFVSHSMEQIARICTKTLVLKSGLGIYDGDVNGGVELYEKLNETDNFKEDKFNSLTFPIVEFDAFPKLVTIKTGEGIRYRFFIKSSETLEQFQIRFYFYDLSGFLAAEGIYDSQNYGIAIKSGINTFSINLASIPLKNGTYKASINILNPNGQLIVWCRFENTVRIQGGHAGALAYCLIDDCEISECTSITNE